MLWLANLESSTRAPDTTSCAGGTGKKKPLVIILIGNPFFVRWKNEWGIANFGMGTRTRVYQAVRTFREGTRLEARRMGKALLNLTL